LREPGGPGVRIDSACEPGLEVGPYYDPLLAKLIAFGRTRDEALVRLRRALDEYVLTGVRTTLPFHRWLVRDDAFIAGDLSTSFIAERWAPNALGIPEDIADVALLSAADLAARQRERSVRAQAADAHVSRWKAAARTDGLR
jgi:acetyl/propionyl-CoA carboxylase alpha subunit